ncbi:hypothetical protein STEG23_018366, partial [Scotinomys teguina]
MKVSLLLVQRKITRTIVLQERIDKGFLKDVFISRKQEKHSLAQCPLRIMVPFSSFLPKTILWLQ